MCRLPQCLWLESPNCRQRPELLARYRSRHVVRLILTVSTGAKCSNRYFYFNTLSPGPVGGDLPRFPHRPREGYIVRPRSPSWRFLLILALHYWTLQFVHDTTRKQPSPETWLACWRSLELLSILIFFYGVSSFMPVYGSSTSLITGLFFVLFSASVVIFMFVFSFLQAAFYVLSRSDPSKFDRRRGFSTRATAAMFIATVINFLLFSLRTGYEVTLFIRQGLIIILDIDYPLSWKPELVDHALRKGILVSPWAGILPVSINLLILDPVSIHTV